MIEIQFEIPENVSKIEERLRAMSKVMRTKSRREIHALFKKTVFGWSGEKKPRFGYIYTNTLNELSIQIFPEGQNAELYKLISEGSPPHIITPKRAGYPLRFRPGYRAATRPGLLQSRRAYRSGQEVRSMSVRHPGFPARDFPDLIRREYEDVFYFDMLDAMESVD